MWIRDRCGANDNIVLPKDSKKSDWEIELGVIIGKKAQYIGEEEALDYVAGYCVANDLSEREFQIERGTQWDKGKGCDTFGPIGPWLVTRDEIPDPQNLDVWLDVNGERMQQGDVYKRQDLDNVRVISESSVLLPVPFPPMNAMIFSFGNSRVTPDRTVFSPYRLPSFSVAIMLLPPLKSDR